MVNFEPKPTYNVEDLRQIVALLRAPGGCPWDGAQTHESLRRNFIEEAYEVAEAIDEASPAHLKEELGDVLLQVLFHASIEEDAGHFDLDDVADAACKKLIFRHPALFGQEGGQSWDELKRREKGYTTHAQSLEAVARSLPALWRARKVQKRAGEAGFQWTDTAAPLSKVEEEVGELRQAVTEGSNVEEELGDALFALVSLARQLDIDPEKALHRATDKFISRFAAMESLAGRDLASLNAAEWRALWQRAKTLTCSE